VSRAALETIKGTENTQVIDFPFATIDQSASKSASWRILETGPLAEHSPTILFRCDKLVIAG